MHMRNSAANWVCCLLWVAGNFAQHIVFTYYLEGFVLYAKISLVGYGRLSLMETLNRLNSQNTVCSLFVC